MSSSLQPHHLANLIQILHDANQRYSLIADSIRGNRAPTHHARKRACLLGLTIDIQTATACPQPQVSQIPLPVLESSPVVPAITMRSRPVLRCQVSNVRSTRHKKNALKKKGILCPPDVPVDEGESFWEDTDDSSSELSPGTALSLMTPIDQVPIKIRFKRKSGEWMENNNGKRPKYLNGV